MKLLFQCFIRPANPHIKAVQTFGQRTVHIIPPVANEELLVEDRPIGTEERILQLECCAGTDMEHLTASRHVSIVT